MLRKIRIAVAAIFLAGLTLLFLGWGCRWLGWMAKIQLLPSFLALNFVVTGAILLLTIIFGRLYCSVICPLGIFQDIMIRLSRLRRKKPVYRKAPAPLRYFGIVLFLVAVFADIQIIISVLDPYSSYGCAVRAITGIGTSDGWWVVTAVGSATILAAALCAWFQGRLWCNSVCPVGFILSVFSRYSIFKFRIDTDKCNGCTACARQCKAACIDAKAHIIDSSRCVDCFDCIDACHQGAISFSPSLKFKDAGKKEETPSSGNGRRNFLTATVMVAVGALEARAARTGRNARKMVAAAYPQGSRTGGGMAPSELKQRLSTNTPPVPFGAGGIKHFYDHCVGCQLCVTSCPNHVLQPSTDPAHFMEPEMSFQRGYCRPECNVCSTVCPAGAIKPLEVGAKLGMHIGTAHVDLDRCVVLTDEVSCGNCARHCPVGAIRMVGSGQSGERELPVVNEELCIGCGACENLCPVRPVSAITVNGLEIHR